MPRARTHTPTLRRVRPVALTQIALILLGMALLGGALFGWHLWRDNRDTEAATADLSKTATCNRLVIAVLADPRTSLADAPEECRELVTAVRDQLGGIRGQLGALEVSVQIERERRTALERQVRSLGAEPVTTPREGQLDRRRRTGGRVTVVSTSTPEPTQQPGPTPATPAPSPSPDEPSPGIVPGNVVPTRLPTLAVPGPQAEAKGDPPTEETSWATAPHGRPLPTPASVPATSESELSVTPSGGPPTRSQPSESAPPPGNSESSGSAGTT